MTAREFSERDIHLALDGELPAEDRPADDTWLRANPDMQARSERFAADAAALTGALEDVMREPVPERLSRLLDAASPARHSAGVTWWRMAAAAVLLAIGLAAGYGIGVSEWRPVDRQALALADSAISAHDVYAAEKLHVVEVGADQKDHLIGWLSKRLGTTLVAPDLTPQGFGLVGGRLLPASEKSAAQFMYEDKEGNRISLYVARDKSHGDTGFRFIEEGGTRALYWLDDGYGCAVAGTVSQAMLTTIAESAYRQLLEGIKG